MKLISEVRKPKNYPYKTSGRLFRLAWLDGDVARVMIPGGPDGEISVGIVMENRMPRKVVTWTAFRNGAWSAEFDSAASAGKAIVDFREDED